MRVRAEGFLLLLSSRGRGTPGSHVVCGSWAARKPITASRNGAIRLMKKIWLPSKVRRSACGILSRMSSASRTGACLSRAPWRMRVGTPMASSRSVQLNARVAARCAETA